MNTVRELRIKKGIQAKQLALDIGVSNATVSDWEHGRKNPTGNRLKKLAEYFGVDEGYILGYGSRGSFEQKTADLFVPEDPMNCGKSQTEQIIERLLQELDNQPKTPEARLLAKGVDRMKPERRKAFTDMMINMCPDIFEKGTETDDT